jgi:hypothetical protein
MVKSFIKFKPVTASSEAHNTREFSPKYLIENSAANIHIVDSKIADRFEQIQKNYLENVKQKMQAKATPIREAVILLPDNDNDTNLERLFSLNDALKEKYGIDAFQTHIHNDEGHVDENGIKKYNYHAHVVYDWTDSKGRNLKLNKEDMSDIQTLTAECLSMQRGEKGSKNLSLNHREYRGFMHLKDQLEKSLKIELDEKMQKDIRQAIKNERTTKTQETERNKNIGTNQGRTRK